MTRHSCVEIQGRTAGQFTRTSVGQPDDDIHQWVADAISSGRQPRVDTPHTDAAQFSQTSAGQYRSVTHPEAADAVSLSRHSVRDTPTASAAHPVERPTSIPFPIDPADACTYRLLDDRLAVESPGEKTGPSHGSGSEPILEQPLTPVAPAPPLPPSGGDTQLQLTCAA